DELVDLVAPLDLLRQRRGRLPLSHHLEGEGRVERGAERISAPHEQRLLALAAGPHRDQERLRVTRALVALDALLEGDAPELLDRVARVDALRAALVAVHAAGAVPDPVRAGVELRPILPVVVAD